MSGAECVVYVYFSHGSKLFGKSGVVLFLFGVETNVFEKHSLAGLKCRCLCLCVGTDNVACKLNVLAEQLGKSLCYGSKRILHVEFALGSAHVGAEDNCGFMVEQVFYSGKRADDSLIVRYNAVLHRYVEIASDKNLLACNINVFN